MSQDHLIAGKGKTESRWSEATLSLLRAFNWRKLTTNLRNRVRCPLFCPRVFAAAHKSTWTYWLTRKISTLVSINCFSRKWMEELYGAVPSAANPPSLRICRSS